MKTLKRANPAVPEDYLDLIRRFPLRRIRSQAEHRAALAMIDELMARGDEQLTDSEADYLEALARFVSDYERDHVLASVKSASPLEVLRHLMESRAMTSADLGRLIGSRSAATMILKGQREMSKSQIRMIAGHFSISPAVLL